MPLRQRQEIQELPSGGGMKQPNIVFIMADDLGYADLSCNGRRDYSTPNIDRIAERGARLPQAYANSAVCSATRLALITGRYQYRLPLGLEEPLAGKTDVGLPPEHPTLPSLLRAAGYGTTLIGKWHLGMPPKFGPSRSGYDHFWGIRTGAIDYYSHKNPRGEDDLWDGDVPVRQTGYLTDLLGDRAVEAIDGYAEQSRPFLLSLHFNAPHWPWEAPGDQAESERLLGGRLRHFDGGTQRTYARMVQAMDHADRTRSASARYAWPDRTTRSSFSPATTAASGSPIPGRSPASKPNYWKAACGFLG